MEGEISGDEIHTNMDEIGNFRAFEFDLVFLPPKKSTVVVSPLSRITMFRNVGTRIQR